MGMRRRRGARSIGLTRSGCSRWIAATGWPQAGCGSIPEGGSRTGPCSVRDPSMQLTSRLQSDGPFRPCAEQWPVVYNFAPSDRESRSQIRGDCRNDKPRPSEALRQRILTSCGPGGLVCRRSLGLVVNHVIHHADSTTGGHDRRRTGLGAW